MADDLDPLREPKFGDPLKELERLLSQPNRAFLLGAGCSKCAGLPLTSSLTELVVSSGDVQAKTKTIISQLKNAFAGAPCVTIEDYLSELVDLLSIAERRKFCSAKTTGVTIATEGFTADEVETAIKDIKKAIAKAINIKTDNQWHRKFIQAIHLSLQSGKSSESRPVDYFILNYDTLIEDAIGLERLELVDGFSGGATGWWNVQSFDAPNVAARIFKVHGSIDWVLIDGNVLPHRIRPAVGDPHAGEEVVIWPAATKYLETQRDPYAQIFKFLRRSLRPVSKSELVLTACGYRFMDSHINLELDQALRESEGRLTIVAFTEELKPTGQLETWLKDNSIQSQVRVYAKGGFFHGASSIIGSSELPWWRFEILTRILGGER